MKTSLGARNQNTNIYEYGTLAKESYEIQKRSITIMRDLPKSIKHGDFRLDYQPVYDLLSKRIVAAEALIRWDHHDYGSIPPSEFIPVAEELGMICSLGRWVLREACNEAANWPLGVRLCVNVSTSQLVCPTFFSDVEFALSMGGLHANRLELELTESAFVEHVLLEDVFKKIRDAGIRISVDDFGVGYSSLSRIRDLCFDTLKLDKSFLLGRVESTFGKCDVVLKTIVVMAKAMEMDVVIEGVESSEDFDYIKELFSDTLLVQGYALCRPLCPKSFLCELGTQAPLTSSQ